VAEPIIWFPDPKAPTTFHGDPASIVRRLVAKLEQAGVPDQLTTSRRLLDQGERLAQAARDAKAAAQRRLDAEQARLFAGEVDTDRLTRTLVEVGPWLDFSIEDGRAAPANAALMEASAQARSHALALVNAEASGVFGLLQAAAREVVDHVTGVPALPQQVWSVNPREAGTTAIQLGHEHAWSSLVKEATRFEAIHQAARMLVDSGGLGVLVYPDGAPEGVAAVWLNWQPALEGSQAARLLPGPLRLVHAVREGWKPGLWLPADHAAQPAKRRGPMEVLAGYVSR
jgi:hypothetical protein